jgi:restriction endonuclease S subunit
MKLVRLSDIISPAGSRAGAALDIPVYSVTKHSGFVPSLEYFNKQVFGRDISNYKVVEEGQFAYATIHLDEGSIGIAPTRALISPMYTVFEADTQSVVPSYLIELLKSPSSLHAYSTMGQGAVERRKSISLDVLGSLKINLPDLDEQERIAKQFAILAEMRTLQLNEENKLSLLRDRVFESMFTSDGESVNVQEISTVGKSLKLKSGETLSKKNFVPGPYKVFGANGETGLHNSFNVQKPTVTIGRVGSCGEINITSANSWITDNALFVVKSTPELPIEYLACALKSANLGQYSSKSNQPLISLDRIKDAQIPIPTDSSLKKFLETLTIIQEAAELQTETLELERELQMALQAISFEVTR